MTFGQLSGTKIIPGDYPTIAAAITALNAAGVGGGGVTFNVAAGHTETAANLVLTTTTSGAANPIVFQKNGVGANPKITAAAGTSTSVDGIIKFQGTDYVTFDGIDILDPVSNTTATTQMEWGYAILMASATNASQYIIIRNCNITLQKVYTSSKGVYSSNHNATSTTSITPSNVTGVVSNCQVDNCTISNVYNGIYFNAYSSATYYGQNNFFGVTAGNTITNFGGSASYVYGIYASYQQNVKVSNNTINGGIGTTSYIYGIYMSTGTNSNVDISFNNIDLSSSGTSSDLHGIYNSMGSSGTNNTVNINNNNIGITYSTGTNSYIYGITQSASAYFCNIYGNKIKNCTFGGGATATATGYFYAINTSGSNSNLGSVWQIYQNTISNFNRIQSVKGSGDTRGISNTGSGRTLSIFENNISDCSWPSTGANYGIYVPNTGASAVNIINNTVSDITRPGSINTLPRTGLLYGIFANATASANQLVIESNNIFNLTNSWGGQVIPVRAEGSTTGSAHVRMNQIYNISTIDQAIFGIYNSTGSIVQIYKNKLHNMVATGDSGSFYGISTASTTGSSNTTVFNNYISDLQAPEANFYLSSGLYLNSSTGGTNHRYYYNTVYLDQVPTAGNPATAAIFARTEPNLDLKNNILVNNSSVLGAGASIVFWRSTSNTATYSSSANFNCFYAGTPGANNLIYYDFTNADQTIAQYQARFPQEGQSFTEIPPFVNFAVKPYDLHLQTNISTPCESGGVAIAVPVSITEDYDANKRYPDPACPVHPNPLYAPSAPDVGADEFGGRPLFTCQAPNPGNTIVTPQQICLGQTVTLSLQNATSGTGNAFQWQSSVDGINFTNIPNATAATYTTTPTSPLWYMCIVRCMNGPITVYSNPVQVSFAVNITSTTPGTRCGTGTVALQAAGTGTVLKWYTNASGGNAIGTGSPFTTPVISSSTIFYVSAETGELNSWSIGSGTSLTSSSGYPTLFGNYWYQDWSQMVYTASELLAAGITPGLINSLTFNLGGLPDANPNNWSLRLGHTASSILSSFITTGLTTVYGPGAPPTPKLGANEIIFTTPFVWDGVSNIIVDIRGTGNYGWANSTCYYTSTTDNTVVSAYSISNNPNFYTSSPSATASKFRLNVIFKRNTLCASARVPVLATVLTPPALTITPDQTVCGNEVAMITVTSPLANYDTYTWSPVTNLFTDAACTVPYVAMTNASTVYAKSGTAAVITYTCLATETTNQCANTAQTTITILPPDPVIISSPQAICVSGSAILSLSPATGYGNATFQWQSSPDNITYIDISGATGMTYTTPIITSTAYYKVLIYNGIGLLCASPTYCLVVNDPTITSTTPATRCGIGTVDLAATSNSGVIHWYDDPTGGTSLASGNLFTTPQINATTTYYAAPEIAGNAGITVGNGISTSAGYQGPFYYLYGGEKSQYLITAAELTAAGMTSGNINSMAFDITSSGSTFNNFNLSVGATASNALTSTFITGMTSVFSAGSITPTTGLFTIYFSNAFFWDGVSNIVVETCWSNEDGGSSPHSHVKYDATGYVATTYYRADYQTASDICNATTGTGTFSSRPKMVFNATQPCIGPRVAVIATVTPAPDLTLTGDQTICNNAVANLAVTSTVVDFDSYVWSPATYLFTDPACTIPYNGVSSASTLYAQTTTPTTMIYTCTAENTFSGCRNIDQTTLTVMPGNLAISSTPEAICVSGSAVLSITPSTGFGTATFQWQDSPDGLVYTDIAGATDMSYTTPVLTSAIYYQCVIKNGSGVICSTPQYALNVNNPQVSNPVPGSRCGIGTVQLGATPSPGSVLNWYGSAIGGVKLGEGNVFTTPVINTTTDFWVEAAIAGGGFVAVGPVSPTAQGGTIGTQTVAWNVNFTTLVPTTISSVDIYPIASGEAGVIQVREGSSTGGTLLATINYTTNVSGGNTPQTITINYDLPIPGSYNLYTSTLPLSGLTRNISGAVYPYTSAVANITGNGYDQTYFMGLYNWIFGSGCASPRQAVTATVNPAPEITPSAIPHIICAGYPSILNVVSPNPGYTYLWTPGNLVGPSQTVFPEVTTYYTVSAQDIITGCANVGTVSVTVLTTPSPIVISPASAAILPGTIQPLTATGGSVPGAVIFTEDFNAPTNLWTTINNSTGGTPAVAAWTLRPDGYFYSYTWHSNDNSQFYLSNSDEQGSGSNTATILQSPGFSTVGFSDIILEFYHHYRHYSSTGKVELSTDGVTWTTLVTNTTTTGAADGFVKVELPIPVTFNNQPIVYLRFKYDASWGYFWGVDNVRITGTGSAGVTWTPLATLYNDPAATIPYTGTYTSTVYAKPTVTTTYTATAIYPATQCPRSQDVLVSVFNEPAVITGPVTPSYYSATGGGTVTSAGGGTILARGVCWSLNPNPTLADNFTTDGTGLGTFVSNLTPLLPNTPYHVRAYATNEVTTTYGQDILFTTLNPCLPPTVLTATNITQTGADLNWTEAGAATSWDLEWGPAGFTQGSGTMVTGLTTKPYILTNLPTNSKYDFYVRSNCGQGVYTAWSGPKQFDLVPLPTILGATEVCFGADPAIYFTQAGKTNYQWTVSAGGFVVFGGGTTDDLIMILWTDAGAQTVSVNYQNSAGVAAPVPTVLPVTVFQPFVAGAIAADQTICAGTLPAMLTATAPTGGNVPYSYQWQMSTDGTAFTDIAGATDLNYQPGSLSQTTWFRMKQTSYSNCGFVYTNVVTITMYGPLVAGTITPDQAICYREDPPSMLTGTPPTGGSAPYGYQWEISADGSNFTEISGATGLTYQPSVLTETTYYRMKQTSSGGCGFVYTNILTITVYPSLSAGAIDADQSICFNTIPAPLTGTPPTGGNPPYSYQWAVSENGTMFIDIPGATNLNYSPGALTTTTYYIMTQTSSSGCGTVSTNMVTITVMPTFAAGSIAADQTIASGATPAPLTGVAPTGGLMPYGYQWQNSADGVNFADIAGATGLGYAPGPLTVTTWYRARHTSAGNCGSGLTNIVKITVSSLPVNLTVQNLIVSDGQTFCYDALETITVAGSGTYFTVNNGGSATFIAGQKITYLPGTKVNPGGYMHGYISNEFCPVIPPAITNAQQTASPVVEMLKFRLYPNPTSGRFTVQQVGDQLADEVMVEVYTMLGERILTERMTGVKKHEFVLPELPAGIYVVKIQAGETMETVKLIRQ